MSSVPYNSLTSETQTTNAQHRKKDGLIARNAQHYKETMNTGPQHKAARAHYVRNGQKYVIAVNIREGVQKSRAPKESLGNYS